MEKQDGVQGIEKLAKALNKVQAHLKPAMKNKENPFFHSDYLDLMGVWESCRAALTENGLSVVQSPAMFNDKFVLITTLLHESGQSMQGVYPIVPVKHDPQGLGSAITYARRYSLAAMVGVCAEDEDDDGEKAMARTSEPERSRPIVPANTYKTASFIPQEIKSRDIKRKDGTPGVAFGISDGQFAYGTFNEELAELARQAKSEGNELLVEYKEVGNYKNIINAKINLDAKKATSL